MISSSSIQVIIPALDEETTIAAVVETLRALGLAHIRVVDNGSAEPRDVARLLAEAEAGADFVLGDRRARPEARACSASAPLPISGSGTSTR